MSVGDVAVVAVHRQYLRMLKIQSPRVGWRLESMTTWYCGDLGAELLLRGGDSESRRRVEPACGDS